MRIGIVVFEDVEELDAVGPWEVLAFWARHVADRDVTLLATSPSGGTVRCAKGLSITATVAFADLPPLDLLVHPGGLGARRLARDEAHLDWVRRQRAAVPTLASVCTGALVYAAAGLLRNRPATTHWGALDQLHELDATIDVRAGERFVDAGPIVTSAGVSAGIDMALHLVSRFGGVEQARRVCGGIQYEAVGKRLPS